MSVILRIVLIIACFITCYYTLHKIRKSQMQIEDSIFWIFFSFILIIISIFPGIAYFISKLLGIGAPVNFVFLSIIFILLFKMFSMSIKISQLEYKIKNLVQQMALQNYELEKENRREKINKR
ncbi:MAG: DUF2304 domain-containing protein [Lachnospiraceae bacterium]|nr:DUF2304 domain-containing protein [Lachnospiraceae bacterium]